MPLSWAIAATDAPGWRLRSTSSRLNASLCLRRVSLAVMTRLSMCAGYVHTSKPRAQSPDRDHIAAPRKEGLEATLTAQSPDRDHIAAPRKEGLEATLTMPWGFANHHQPRGSNVPTRQE